MAGPVDLGVIRPMRGLLCLFHGFHRKLSVMIDAGNMRLTTLREAIHANRVSFPSQVPMFVRNAPRELQCHSVQLYFLRGWTCQMIARRYGCSRLYIWQIVKEWKRHAVALGYVQAIPPPRARAVRRSKRVFEASYQPAA